MPSFVPRTAPIRKKEILEKRETELRHALKQNGSLEKINRLAEKVRVAHLNLLKAKKHLDQTFRPEDNTVEHDRRSAKIDEQVTKWTKYSAEEIIETFKKNTEQSS